MRVNGAAFNKDYCQGQRDNKRELCEATDSMIGQIFRHGGGGVEVMPQQVEQFVKGHTLLESRPSVKYS